ncbi:DUF3630 family protein [Aquipseudomonas alcaligenes]|uniref:Uncharacterized protein n=2 Tax=Aquipseudomonas alcaligenes TaxID=43263 RepID=A0ABD0B0Q7_AQUAC|nr:hypothetical protein KAM426_15180 [Pseudomonas alcaligenes]GIZ77766.1 hypothetical protein KAM430_41750 [Pseudomonas alcaligenes]GIZ95205.1 hypothetical protein KAM436_41730 [Pseudomonas alcaligenes]
MINTRPEIMTMASGNLSLLITEDVSWESFPAQAEEFLKKFNGKLVKRIDTPVERIWIVLIKWRPFWLSYDDFPLGLSLDSMHSFCNSVVKQIHQELIGANAI